MPHPQNACTSSWIISKLVAKADDGTISSAWKTILELKPNFQGGVCTVQLLWASTLIFLKTRQIETVCKFLSTATCIVCNFFVTGSGKWRCLENDSHLLFTVCTWCEKQACPLKNWFLRAEFPLCVHLQKKCAKFPFFEAMENSSFTFVLVSEGAVKSLFFGGHCVLIARLSFAVEKSSAGILFSLEYGPLCCLFCC